MTYCNEKQMPCEWARIGGGCSVSACRKVLFTHGGWPMPIEQPEFVKPPKTNADHIRSMTDEELAMFLDSFGSCNHCPQYGEASFVDSGIPTCDGDCEQHISDWLKQPYKENT